MRARLQQRRSLAIIRHARRTIARLVVLATADVLATLSAREGIIAIGSALRSAGVRGFADLAAIRTLSPAECVIAALLSLFLTGAYTRNSRSGSDIQIVRGGLFAALLLAAGAAPVIGIGLMPSAAVAFAIIVALLSLGRYCAARVTDLLFVDGRWSIPAVLVGFARASTVPGEEDIAPLDREYRVVSRVAVASDLGAPSYLHELGEIINYTGAEAVVVSGELLEDELETVFDISVTAGCELLYPARAVRIAGVRPSLVWRGNEPFFELGTPVLKAQQLFIKRCIDILGASAALMCAAPTMLIVALLVRLDSPGPIFFRQDRAGLGGRRFKMLKFRTMHANADAQKAKMAHLNASGDARLFKIPNDPRITRIGRVLRRWSLDELPQFWNVLRGDMSLIGPRPFFQSDLNAYEAHHFRRLGAKPGITGLWQVSGRSAIVDFEEVVRLDREYIERWSIWLDLAILFRTLPAVLRNRGAY